MCSYWYRRCWDSNPELSVSQCCAFSYHAWSSFWRDGIYLGTKQDSLPMMVEKAKTYEMTELIKI